MSDFLQDLRYGLRMLGKAPVVMAVAAISLAFGISANTVTFSVANGFMFAPFPYENQHELVAVYENHRKNIDDYETVSAANYFDWRERTTVFEDLVAYDVIPANLTGGDHPDRVNLVLMPPETFAMLGQEPILGRDFDRSEGTAGDVVVLSHTFWHQYFAASPDVLGSQVTLDGEPHTVIGVMGEGFDFIPANVDVFRPTDWSDRREERDNRSLVVMGRLRDGRTVEQARAELEAIASQLELEHPEANAGYGVYVVGLREMFPGPTDTTLMYILMTVAGFVLIIACANIANLLLARAEDRQREIAVRTAMGAGRIRILRQLLTESVLLAIIGGALGTFFSVYGVRWVATAMPAEIPRSLTPQLDATVLAYTLGLSMLAGILFGIAPALHSFGEDIREALGENSRGGTATKKRNRLRSSFVVAELAAALALLVGGGVLMSAFDALVEEDTGFEVEGVLTAALTVSEDRYPDDAGVTRFYQDIIRELEAAFGEGSVATMLQLPRSRGVAYTDFTLDAHETPQANDEPTTDWQAVNHAYFTALGVPITSGRGFEASDRADTQSVVVVNQRFVDVFLPDEDVLGQQVTILGASRRIVGISNNVFQTRMPREGGALGPIVYVPMAQHPMRSMSLAMRVSGDPATLAPMVRSAIGAVDPDQPVTAIQTLVEHIDTQLAGPRTISVVLGVFGISALLLSAIGIYGVMAHSVVQRRREIGIRMALGAARNNVVGLVTRQGLRLAVIGLAIGAPIAFAIVRAIQSLVFSGDDAIDWTLVATVTGTLIVVAVLATFLPAMSASRIHPVRALQSE